MSLPDPLVTSLQVSLYMHPVGNHFIWVGIATQQSSLFFIELMLLGHMNNLKQKRLNSSALVGDGLTSLLNKAINTYSLIVVWLWQC